MPDINAELMEQCRMLKEYAQYVARVRGYTASMKLEEAVAADDLRSVLRKGS